MEVASLIVRSDRLKITTTSRADGSAVQWLGRRNLGYLLWVPKVSPSDPQDWNLGPVVESVRQPELLGSGASVGSEVCDGQWARPPTKQNCWVCG